MVDNTNNYYENIYLNTAFPEKTQSINEFKHLYIDIKKSITELVLEDLEKERDIQSYIENSTKGIQLRTIPDEIEETITRILGSEENNEHLKYIESEVIEKIKGLSPTRVTQNRLSRLAGKIKNVPNELKTYEEIISTRRRQNVLSSYSLTDLSRSTRLRRQFVSVNSIIFPHYIAKTKIEKKACEPDTNATKYNQTEKSNSRETDEVEEHTAIVTVSFYHQIRGMKIAEFDVLDSQKLSCLKDAFRCEDSILEEELLNFSSSGGGCFEINGDLYTDSRNKGLVNYATNLKGFTKKGNKAQIYEMESLSLSQIQIPINNHCTYIHSGDCEHRVTFTNIRVFDPKHDCPYKKAYPIQTYSHSKTLAFCEICGVNQVQKFVFNAINLPRNPSQLCDPCALAFLYDNETKQLVEKCTIRSVNSSCKKEN